VVRRTSYCLLIALWAPCSGAQLKVCSDLVQRAAAQEAVTECKATVARDPASAPAHFLLGQAYLLTRSVSMVAEAKAEFQQALDIDPDLAWARFYLARVYIDIGRPDKAKEELLAGLKSRPGTGHFISLLGEAERKLGNPQAAVDLQAQALKADATLSPAHYYAALAYMDMNNDDAAVAELEESIRSPHVAPDMYLTLGSIYARRKRYKEAEQLCMKGIALDPSRSEGYLNMAQLQNAQGGGERALAALRKAMPEGKSFPTSPYYQKLQADIHMEFGRAWETTGQPDKALHSYLSCVGLDSERAEAHARLAALYTRKGDAARARIHATAAEKPSAEK